MDHVAEHSTTEKKTYCRICEALCGLSVTTEGGRITRLKSSKEHVLSQGHLCAKAQAASEVSYDSDRVLHPLKRNRSSGEFEKISWSQAISDIAKKLLALRASHGNESVATYTGNPMAFASSAQIWRGVFQKLLGIKWAYGVGAEDTVAPMVASSLLYGSLGHILKPDLWRTDFSLVMGANPYVSHSSLFSEPLLRKAFKRIKEQSGRVVVVDPRRTETARDNEHIGLNAGTDAYLLLGMLHTITTENLADMDGLRGKVDGFDVFARQLNEFTPELAAEFTGIDADVIRQLARDFAMAESACVVGRTGTCTQQFGTLNNLLQNILCLVTGNVDKEGGMLFGHGLVDLSVFLEKSGGDNYGAVRSRTTGQVSVAQILPSTALPSDILQPGDGQIRALFTIAANPMLNTPVGGEYLQRALEDLDLHVSLDLYVNDTNKLADYILPVTTMYEREDLPIFGMDAMLRPSVWATDAVAEPQGDVKQEWQIFNDLCREMGFGGCYDSALLRGLARLGYQTKPKFFFDMLIRTSPWGDRFGLRPSGLSFKKLVTHYPDGHQLMPHLPTGVFDKKIRTDSGRVNIAKHEIIGEIHRLSAHKNKHINFPYRLIGQREMLSQNSWLHNVETTMRRNREQTAKVHPDDAAQHGLMDGDVACIESPWGAVSVKVKLTEDMTPGNVALPHGWGHIGGGWQKANLAGGVNSNILASHQPEDGDPISGGSVLNGVPIRLSAGVGGVQ